MCACMVCVCVHTRKGHNPAQDSLEFIVQLRLKFIVVLLPQFPVWKYRHELLCLANFHSFVDELSTSTKCVSSVSSTKVRSQFQVSSWSCNLSTLQLTKNLRAHE